MRSAGRAGAIVAGYVLVTGASRGLGRVLAREFSRNGHDLVVTARDLTALETLAIELRTEYGTIVHAIGVDLATENGPRTLIELCHRRGLAISAIINNAAILPAGATSAMEPDLVRQTLNLNIKATTELALGFLPQMLAARNGVIFNISSLASLVPLGSAGLYSASKAYLTSFSHSLNRELSDTGVECITVVLGPVRTQMLTASGAEQRHGFRWMRWLAPPPESVASVIYDSYLTRRSRFSAGLLGTSLLVLLRLLPQRLARPIVNQLT